MCLQKMYNLAKALRFEDPEQGTVSIKEITPEMTEFLPEYLLLEFLLGLDLLDNVQNFADIYMTVPEIELKEGIIPQQHLPENITGKLLIHIKMDIYYFRTRVADSVGLYSARHLRRGTRFYTGTTTGRGNSYTKIAVKL